MFHGGGTTGILQANNTHVNSPLSELFKKRVMDDAHGVLVKLCTTVATQRGSKGRSGHHHDARPHRHHHSTSSESRRTLWTSDGAERDGTGVIIKRPLLSSASVDVPSDGRAAGLRLAASVFGESVSTTPSRRRTWEAEWQLASCDPELLHLSGQAGQLIHRTQGIRNAA